MRPPPSPNQTFYMFSVLVLEVIPPTPVIFQIPEDHLEGLSLWNETHPDPVRVVYKSGAGVANTDYILYVRSLPTQACVSQVGRKYRLDVRYSFYIIPICRYITGVQMCSIGFNCKCNDQRCQKVEKPRSKYVHVLI